MDEIIDRLRKVRKGAMFIIEAPSGTGKGTVIKELLKNDSNIKFSVSVTTRQPRVGEVEGVDYYFVTDVNGKFYYASTLRGHEKNIAAAAKVGDQVHGTDTQE